MEKLCICEVLKPQGIKGEIKVKLYTDSFNSVKSIKTIYDENGKEFLVEYIKDAFCDCAFIKLKGVNTRNDSELLRQKTFYADKMDIKKNKNSYFISDLIGLNIIIEDNEVGKIVDITKSNVDMLEIQFNDGKKGVIPFIKTLKPIIDLDKKTIIIDKEIFEQTVYYES